jgi:hypothetical protein
MSLTIPKKPFVRLSDLGVVFVVFIDVLYDNECNGQILDISPG